MKRQLVIMRHAKSSWDVDGLADHARSLNPRGRRDAPRIGERLAELGWEPSFVVSSDSQRTRETCELLLQAFSSDVQVRFTNAFYCGDLSDIRDDAEDWQDGIETVLCLGHNPGWQMAVGSLCGQADSMTTANAVMLEGEGGSWTEALHNDWRLVEWLRPKEL